MISNYLFIYCYSVTTFFVFVKDVSALIRVRDNWMVDEYDRVRLFHGFNSVKKGPPWFDEQILNETRLLYYNRWGFNVVRLGTMWSGVEPSENEFNETYIDILYKITETLDKYGMNVILDAHQDVFSSAVCEDCYDGFPRWLSRNFTPSILKYPWPFNYISGENWALGYLTYSVSSAFQQFYDNTSGSADKFVRFWVKIAEKFKNQNNILGYELLNEPWAGNVFYNPQLLLPGIAGYQNLKPLYDRLFVEIRKVDDHTNIFYEPVTWGVLGRSELFGSGFKELPGGESFQNRSVFSYHIYCWVMNVSALHSKYPWPLKALCDSILASNIFLTVADDILKTGGSSFLTEFGLCEPDGNPLSIDTMECDFILDKSDEHLQSWTYWDSLFFDDNGFPKPEVIKSFSRPYAMATAGIPVMMKFDLDEQIFQFEFRSRTKIRSSTEIFIPIIHYPDELLVDTQPLLKWIYHKKSSLFKIYTFHLLDNTLVKITIKPLH
ncbi:hypothetical protein HELRODRAFT_86747 [Helobdella robusta]|uniref:Glycoside hydrolase family 5 domain-containing protein n=1 Tax=Helobdella robusta TaxID=6412 RepID=T1G6G3_HELRO|nr:hypothetical protein HELRODRAFT_86747 [Helobdella robusta]ESN95342.1 hypothetical protein HELRODRAFT_86747 [Helobdella robusta]